MNNQKLAKTHGKIEIDAATMVAEVDTGARNPAGWQGKMILSVALVWSLFQIFVASKLPFIFTQLTGINVTLNSDEVRSIHLAFAMFLAATAFPLFKGSPRKHIPWYDWILAAIGVTVCLYLVVNKNAIADRSGLPTITDLAVSGIGIVVLLLSTWRALGLPLVIVASFFMLYVFFGHYSFLPEVVQWKGASFSKAMWHFWMQTEGVFGVALGVSASMVFLFVLFGSLLDKAGAGNYFIKVSFSLLGALQGRTGKSSGCILGHDRTYFRIIDCQHGYNRHFHNSVDEAGWLSAGKGWCSGGSIFHQWPADTASYGGCGLFDGGVCRGKLSRRCAPCFSTGCYCLYRTGLHCTP
jgi:TRAP-type uncharacterized transport system fused permease subunit